MVSDFIMGLFNGGWLRLKRNTGSNKDFRGGFRDTDALAALSENNGTFERRGLADCDLCFHSVLKV